ncbi:MAG: alpha-L-rhamnosidase C-terminal domain-containing protein, partial [Sphingorhabdus sp.]
PKSDRCIITLLYIGSLKQAAELETAVGEAGQANANRASANQLSQAVNAQCWSADRGLYADNPDKTVFSQHANALAVLYDVAPRTTQVGIIDRITVRNGGIAAPKGVTGTTYYFAFYLARALDHAGLGGRYSELLHTWRGMLNQNFTTWPEEPDPTRSDSHAWSAHPTADLLHIVAGIQPASPGFVNVKIIPHLGPLKSLNAAMAHPSGMISVRYRREGKTLRATIRLPESVSGEFVWGGQRIALRGGQNQIKLRGND